MFNSRDSGNINLDDRNTYKVPYSIGTIIEKKENPDDIAKVISYIINRNGMFVTLSHDVYKENSEFLETLSLEELKDKWKETERIIITGPIGDKMLLGFDDIFEEEHRRLKVTEEGIALVKK